tara:strand:- start:1061 stop:2392 length:1332 start_codon:yes stop_codon:yes gene_type:complete
MSDLSQLMPLVKDFLDYAKGRMGFNRPPTINFQSDSENAKNALGRTAYYDPQSFSVTIFVDDRHPKDIMRSLAHELVHHTQNCDGRLTGSDSTEPGYAQTNTHLRGLEKDAYLNGNLCFRDWEDKRKQQLQETNYYERSETLMSYKNWRNDQLNKLITEKYGYRLPEAVEELEEVEEIEEEKEDKKGKKHELDVVEPHTGKPDAKDFAALRKGKKEGKKEGKEELEEAENEEQPGEDALEEQRPRGMGVRSNRASQSRGGRSVPRRGAQMAATKAALDQSAEGDSIAKLKQDYEEAPTVQMKGTGQAPAVSTKGIPSDAASLARVAGKISGPAEFEAAIPIIKQILADPKTNSSIKINTLAQILGGDKALAKRTLDGMGITKTDPRVAAARKPGKMFGRPSGMVQEGLTAEEQKEQLKEELVRQAVRKVIEKYKAKSKKADSE